MTKSNFDELTKKPMFARPPLPDEGDGDGLWRDPEEGWPERPKDRADGAIRDGRVAGIQELDEGARGEDRQIAWLRCSTT